MDPAALDYLREKEESLIDYLVKLVPKFMNCISVLE